MGTRAVRWWLSVLFGLWAVLGFGADNDGGYTARGQGTMACGVFASTYEQDRRERPSAQRETYDFSFLSEWIAGYLTAYNRWVYEGADVAHDTDVEGWERWIYEWCSKSPTEKLYVAVEAFVFAHTPDPLLREIQKHLSELGYDPGPADGFQGPRTRAAIRQFQQDRSLEADGKASWELHEQALRAIVEDSISTQPGSQPAGQ